MSADIPVPKHHHAGMVLIAGIKILKGALSLFVGFGLLKLVHADIATLFSQLLEAMNLGADSRLIHALVLKVDALQPHSIMMMSVAIFLYGGLELTEGLGLWFERAWAAYLTVIATSLFIPFELYEIVQKVTFLRVGALIGNVVIVLYLISQLKHHTLISSQRTAAKDSG